MQRITSTRALTLLTCIAVLQACTVNVPVSTPEVSMTPFEGADQSVELALTSGLGVSHEVSQGGLPLKVHHEDKALNAEFFLDNLQAELAARGLTTSTPDDAANTLTLNDFSILHHRVSGFSPMVTLSMVSADLETPAGTQRITSFIRRAKVPVWSMDEIIEPCYNDAVEILVRETAAKINQALFDKQLDDETVQTIAAGLAESPSDDKYMDVLELGYSNNPQAIPTLLELSANEQEYIRQAAITGLGILGAEQHLDHLKDIYETAESWADRGTALKAIGDIGTPAAIAILTDAKSKWMDEASNEGEWNRRILGLYLD